VLTAPIVNIYKSGFKCSQCIRSIITAAAEAEYVVLLMHLPYEVKTSQDTKLDPNLDADLYGMHFLSHIVPEIQSRGLSAKVIPIALVDTEAPAAWIEVVRSLGAIDVLKGPLSSPISEAQIQSLIDMAHDFAQTSRERLFTSMTQGMIAQLMGDLCNPSRIDPVFRHT